MHFDPDALDRRAITSLVNAIVAPRPIAWVSTLAPDGTPNLAPFSYFNAFSTSPPTVALGPGSRAGVAKDTLRNARASGEFVVNAVSHALALTANLTSAELPAAAVAVLSFSLVQRDGLVALFGYAVATTSGFVLVIVQEASLSFVAPAKISALSTSGRLASVRVAVELGEV